MQGMEQRAANAMKLNCWQPIGIIVLAIGVT